MPLALIGMPIVVRSDWGTIKQSESMGDEWKGYGLWGGTIEELAWYKDKSGGTGGTVGWHLSVHYLVPPPDFLVNQNKSTS